MANEDTYRMYAKLTEESKKRNLTNLNEKDSSFLGTLAGVCLNILGTLALIGLAWLYNIFAYGYVGSIMWTWFIMPLFPSMPAISLLQAAGLSLMVTFFTHDHLYRKTPSDQSTMDKIMTMVVPAIAPWVTLLVGYIVHCMLM